jgi:hypothetical protein
MSMAYAATVALPKSRPVVPLQRLQLRWFALGITLVAITCFMLVAAFDHRAARVALAGSVVVAFNGVTWLLILRRYRARLRRHGFRW